MLLCVELFKLTTNQFKVISEIDAMSTITTKQILSGVILTFIGSGTPSQKIFEFIDNNRGHEHFERDILIALIRYSIKENDGNLNSFNLADDISYQFTFGEINEIFSRIKDPLEKAKLIIRRRFILDKAFLNLLFPDIVLSLCKQIDRMSMDRIHVIRILFEQSPSPRAINQAIQIAIEHGRGDFLRILCGGKIPAKILNQLIEVHLSKNDLSTNSIINELNYPDFVPNDDLVEKVAKKALGKQEAFKLQLQPLSVLSLLKRVRNVETRKKLIAWLVKKEENKAFQEISKLITEASEKRFFMNLLEKVLFPRAKKRK
jgi:hypothetical protein